MALDKSAAILLADDDSYYRELMREMLNSLGFENIHEAADGQEAMLVGKACKPLFALIDIYMPRMNGWEVVQRFKRELPDTILVMVTGSMGREDVDTAFVHGVDGYFFKPCDKDIVLATLTQLADLKDQLKRAGKN